MYAVVEVESRPSALPSQERRHPIQSASLKRILLAHGLNFSMSKGSVGQKFGETFFFYQIILRDGEGFHGSQGVRPVGILKIIDEIF